MERFILSGQGFKELPFEINFIILKTVKIKLNLKNCFQKKHPNPCSHVSWKQKLSTNMPHAICAAPYAENTRNAKQNNINLVRHQNISKNIYFKDISLQIYWLLIVYSKSRKSWISRFRWHIVNTWIILKYQLQCT